MTKSFTKQNKKQLSSHMNTVLGLSNELQEKDVTHHMGLHELPIFHTQTSHEAISCLQWQGTSAAHERTTYNWSQKHIRNWPLEAAWATSASIRAWTSGTSRSLVFRVRVKETSGRVTGTSAMAYLEHDSRKIPHTTSKIWRTNMKDTWKLRVQKCLEDCWGLLTATTTNTKPSSAQH